MIARSILELMGNTPLVELRSVWPHPSRVKLYGKLELAMPGQMKDRVALNIIRHAEADGLLRHPDRTHIVESTSGTFGEGLARVAAVLGYHVTIVSDPGLDAMTAAKIMALGARIIRVPKEAQERPGGYQRARLEVLAQLLREDPTAFWPRQYDNPHNAGAYQRVAHELVNDLGTVDVVVGAVGSGGSLGGIARELRTMGMRTSIVAVDAVNSVQFYQPNGPRRQRGHGNSLVTDTLEAAYPYIQTVHWVDDEHAFAACHSLAATTGIYAGGSSGAVYLVASWYTARYAQGNIVAILPDRGDRYADVIYSSTERTPYQAFYYSLPVRIVYGEATTYPWAYATLPHHRGQAAQYHAPDVPRSSQLTLELGIHQP